MKVAFDTVMLAAYLHPEAKYPPSFDRLPERLKHLVTTLDARNATVIIPTPALSEFLVLAANQGPAYVSELADNSVFRIEPFDQMAAIEAADAQIRATAQGDKRGGATGRWQVVKVDRQIVAVAKVRKVDVLYAGEKDVRNLAASMGVVAQGPETLPLPPQTLFTQAGLSES